MRGPRSRKSLVAAALLAICGGSGRAEAQVDAQRFKPPVTYDGWVNAEGSSTRHPDDRWALGAWMNYAHRPLVVGSDGELVRSFVAGRLGFDAVVSVSLTRRLSIGAALPLFVLQSGDVSPSASGIGDLRLVPKLEILSDLKDGMGLALLAEARLPTHSGDFSGGRGVELWPKIALDHRYPSGVRVGFNLGVVLRATQRLANLEAGDELTYAAALGYRLGGPAARTEIGVELQGAMGLGERDPEELPLELFGFLRHDLDRDWQIIGGPAVGLLEGYGVPTLRGFVGVRYAPTRHDRDADGHADAEDACPDDAEDLDGYEDADGCPEEDPDLDRDGVSDSFDECPDAKETINGVSDEDGCPDVGDRRVIYDNGQLMIVDAIRFEHGSSEITAGSHSLLDQIALTLKANPEIEHIRVEGHTDDTGPRAINMQLSEARAHSVRRYLIQRGVSPARLRVRSYGPDRPAVEGTDAATRARNRRVEFVLE